METCDDEFVEAASDFIQRQHNRRKPFFCWVNTTHMHLRTHTRRRSLGQAGRWQSPYHDTMLDYDKNVGQLLDLLDPARDRGRHDRHIGTDNGPHTNTWPDGAMTPFRSEKNELGRRVPRTNDGALARQDPGGCCLERDRPAPRLASHVSGGGRRARRRREVEEGPRGGSKTFKVHIDGYNLHLTGEEEESPRKGFIYFSDDGDLVALRFDNWKLVFMEQRMPGTMALWAEPFTPLRLPKLFNLRTDPFERADTTSNTYWDCSPRRPT
jgi:arylsulfatase